MSEEFASWAETITVSALIVFGLEYAMWAWRTGGHGHSHGNQLDHGRPQAGGSGEGAFRWLLPFRGLAPALATSHDHDGMQVHSHSHHQHLQGVAHAHFHYHHHGHQHEQADRHLHPHDHARTIEAINQSTSPGWGLIAIVGLSPCIALLPFSFAAERMGMMAVIMVLTLFGVVTIATLLGLVFITSTGMAKLQLEFFEKRDDVLTGLAIFAIGILTLTFGL